MKKSSKLPWNEGIVCAIAKWTIIAVQSSLHQGNAYLCRHFEWLTKRWVDKWEMGWSSAARCPQHHRTQHLMATYQNIIPLDLLNWLTNWVSSDIGNLVDLKMLN